MSSEKPAFGGNILSYPGRDEVFVFISLIAGIGRWEHENKRNVPVLVRLNSLT